jgi:hypothetical protein
MSKKTPLSPSESPATTPSGPLATFGLLVSVVERVLGAKVRLRAEQDLLPVYVAVSPSGSCGHRHQSAQAAARCAAVQGRRGGAWAVQAVPGGPRLRWGVTSR